MSYADAGLGQVIGCCPCFSRGEKQPARISATFGSRRGHFNVNSNLVGAVETASLSPLERVTNSYRNLQNKLYPNGELVALGLGFFGAIGLLHWRGVIDANKLSDQIFGEGAAKK